MLTQNVPDKIFKHTICILYVRLNNDNQEFLHKKTDKTKEFVDRFVK